MENPRQHALLQQAHREEERLERHRPVVALLRSSKAQPVLEYARGQVQKWRQGQLCSRDYIEAWESLLSDPVQVAAVLEERSSRGRMLRQNTPFAAYLASDATADFNK